MGIEPTQDLVEPRTGLKDQGRHQQAASRLRVSAHSKALLRKMVTLSACQLLLNPGLLGPYNHLCSSGNRYCLQDFLKRGMKTGLMPSALKKMNAFTLAELLVVMAVLSLLIVILAPSLGRVIPIARRTQCAINLKNIVVGYQSRQSEDNKPPMGPGAWAEELLPYLSHNESVLVCPEDENPHSSLPDIKLRVSYVSGIDRVDHNMQIFGSYPYWLEGGCPDPGPSIWKLNDQEYYKFINPSSQAYAPDVLPRYEPGADPHSYWYVFEESMNVILTATDWDYNDFDMHVQELPNGMLEVTCHKYWYSANYAFILSDGTLIGGGGSDPSASVGQGGLSGPFYFPYTDRLSYGINWQGQAITPADRKIIFLDYERDVCYAGGLATTVASWDIMVAPRHLGRVNAAFTDGTVGTFYPEEINPEAFDGGANDAEHWSPSR